MPNERRGAIDQKKHTSQDSGERSGPKKGSALSSVSSMVKTAASFAPGPKFMKKSPEHAQEKDRGPDVDADKA